MVSYKAPGVYIEEVDSGSRPISGASTSVAAFVGFSAHGPGELEPTEPTDSKLSDKEKKAHTSRKEARNLAKAASSHYKDAKADPQGLKPKKINNWGEFDRLYGGFEESGLMMPHAVYGWFANGGTAAYIVRVPHKEAGESAESTPASSPKSGSGSTAAKKVPSGAAVDGIGPSAFINAVKSLDVAEDVTIVVAPDLVTAFGDDDGNVDSAGLKSFQDVQMGMIEHCENEQNRLAILDAPPGQSRDKIKDWPAKIGNTAFATLYYPWIKISNPLYTPNGDHPQSLTVPPSGHVAGIWARNDAERGAWKSPANEPVRGASDLESIVTRADQAVLNPVGVNCIRAMGPDGIRVWGARTLAGDTDNWKYIAVRRLFNYVESSILQSTNWVVFEPNDAPLWGRVDRTITAFLTTLWRQGGLAGTTPEQAFYVKCDAEVNPQESIDQGVLVCEIGMAPLKPAEFVVFRISQWHPGA